MKPGKAKYYIYLLVILNVLYTKTHGQNFAPMGDLAFGSKGQEYLTKTIQTSDGGYLLVGFANTVDGEISGPPQGNYDYWVIKTSSNGAIEWNKLLGSQANDYVYDATEDLINGGYVIIGYTEAATASGHISTVSEGGYSDIWIIKISGTGEIIWENRLGGDNEDYAISITQTLQGNFLIAGFTNSTPTTGDLGSDFSRGDFDYRLVEISLLGNVLWDKRLGGANFEGSGLSSVAGGVVTAIQTSDGGYLLGGNSLSQISGDKSKNNQGDKSDIWIVKLDAFRNIQWDITLGAEEEETLTSITELNDGNYFIGGTTQSNDPVLGFPPNKDYWIIKLNKLGSQIWNQRVGGSMDDELKSVIETADGGFLLGGWSFSTNDGDKSQPNFGSADYWIVKLFTDGTKEWDNVYGGTEGEFLSTLIETSDGGYLLSGTSNSPISGNKTASSKGGDDFWLIKLGGTIALPVDLISFTAQVIQNNLIELSWITASETDNDYFTIERSPDHIHFHKISEVSAAKNSKQVNTYSVIDSMPLNGVAYYRLKQTDFNGKFTYSKTIAIHFDNIQSEDVLLFPNPASRSNLSIELNNFFLNKDLTIIVEDILGNKVIEKTITQNKDYTIQVLNRESDIGTGVFILTIINSDTYIVRKFIIN